MLPVQISSSGKRWVFSELDEQQYQNLSSLSSYPEILCRLLALRGVALDNMHRFLNPRLSDQLPDPSHLKDMDVGVARIVTAITTGEKIAIFGDYDVDGATSSSLLYRFITAVGGEAIIHIPDRFTEGYGPNLPALLNLQQQGASLIITVDCGTTAHQVLNAAAREHKLDIVVLDHHGADSHLPEVVAVINPNRQDDDSPLKYVAAVGLSFIVAVAVNRSLRKINWYDPQSRPEPDLLSLLDLVALGTVCDVVPLIGLNRVFVSQGLKVMRATKNLGLQTLIDISKISSESLDVYHLGYMLGPRINAGGRIGKSSLGAQILTTTDPIVACNVGAELNRLNLERRDIEQQTLLVAQQQAETQASRKIIIVTGDDWHEGIIGIVAGRIKDQFHRPTVVISWQKSTEREDLSGNSTSAENLCEDSVLESSCTSKYTPSPVGVLRAESSITSLPEASFQRGLKLDESAVWTGKGSARSISGFDMGAVIRKACQAGLLKSGGGHAMAGGLTIEREKFEQFEQFMQQQTEDTLGEADLLPTLKIDGVLDPQGMTIELIEALQLLGPFGAGNPTPRFAFFDVQIKYAEVVGMNHIRCTLTSQATGANVAAMAFRAMDKKMGEVLLKQRHQAISVAGTISVDTWQGKKQIKLMIDDVL